MVIFVIQRNRRQLMHLQQRLQQQRLQQQQQRLQHKVDAVQLHVLATYSRANFTLLHHPIHIPSVLTSRRKDILKEDCALCVLLCTRKFVFKHKGIIIVEVDMITS